MYSPPQNFVIGGNNFFISEDDSYQVNASAPNTGYWIVPYVIDDGNGEARPAKSRTVELPDALKFTYGLPEIASMYPYPDRDYARLNEHFIVAKANYYDVNIDFLKRALDQAEAADYEFALRMQGLQNCNINAVWTCADLGFDAYDRSLIMEQFLRGYVGRFLSQVSQKPGADLNPDHVVREAIQMHDKFCDAWVKEHKRGLSPLIESCAEALVGNFCDSVLRPAVLAGLTRREISRIIRRDPVTSPQFGLCLHFFMVKLDQDRTGRNANYKSMINSFNSNILAMKTFENFMRSNMQTVMRIVGDLNGMGDPARSFHPMVVDWYSIVTQLHVPRVHYTGVSKRRRTVGGAGGDGPMIDAALGPGGLWGT